MSWLVNGVEVKPGEQLQLLAASSASRRVSSRARPLRDIASAIRRRLQSAPPRAGSDGRPAPPLCEIHPRIPAATSPSRSVSSDTVSAFSTTCRSMFRWVTYRRSRPASAAPCGFDVALVPIPERQRHRDADADLLFTVARSFLREIRPDGQRRVSVLLGQRNLEALLFQLRLPHPQLEIVRLRRRKQRVRFRCAVEAKTHRSDFYRLLQDCPLN